MEYVYGGHLGTKAEVIAAIHQHELAHLLDRLEPLIRPSIRLTYTDPQPDVYPVGASRVGGLPDLLPNAEWPHWPGTGAPDEHSYDPGGPHCFLAQINLAEITAYDVERTLPSSGMLYFFASIWVNCISYTGYANEREMWRVLYYDGDLSALRRRPLPFVSEELRADTQYRDNAPLDHVFKPCALTLELEWTLPNFSYSCPAFLALDLSEEDKERYAGLSSAVSPEVAGEPPIEYPPTHRMLGHPQCGQVYSSDPASYLLLQLDSDFHSVAGGEMYPIYWEFGGRGYFFIQPDALQARDFANVELVYECD